MARSTQRTRRRRSLGKLTPEQLLAHRELELLRVAAGPARNYGARRRQRSLLSVRFHKLKAARARCR